MITLTYDNLNRLVARSNAVAVGNVSFSYDLAGRRKSAKYAEGSYNVGGDGEEIFLDDID